MTIKTGIEVTGKLVAGNIISGARAAKSAVESIGAGAARAKAATVSAFKAIGGSMTALNQGLEVGKKAAALLSAAFAITAGKALELRAANDPAKKSLEDAGKAADRLGVAIGDVLVPMLAAAASALAPVVEGAARWLDLNRTMIASQFVPWLGDVGKTLVSGVATGFVLAAKAAYGLKMATGAVEDAANQAQAAIARDAVARLNIAIRDQGLRSWEREAMIGRLEEQEALVKKYDDAAEASARGVGQAIADLAALEAKTADTALAIQRGIGDAAADVFARLAQGAIKAKAVVKDLGDEIKIDFEAFKNVRNTQADAERAAFDAQIAMRRRGVAVEIAFADQVAEYKRSLRERELVEAQASVQNIVTLAGGAISSLGAGINGIVDGIIDGTKTAAEIMADFGVGLVKAFASSLINLGVQIAVSKLEEAILGSAVRSAGTLGYAAQAAAAAYASTAAIPIVGPALAPAAATAAGYGAIAAAAATGGLGLAEGGLVRGGSAGFDSVPARLMPGEFVTPAADVRRNLAAGRDPDDRGGGGVIVNATVQQRSFGRVSRADLDRAINNDLIPSINRAIRDGRINLRGRG